MQTKIILTLTEAQNICKGVLVDKLSCEADLNPIVEVSIIIPELQRSTYNDIWKNKIPMIKFLRCAVNDLAKANKININTNDPQHGNVTLFDAKTYVEQYLDKLDASF